MSRIISVSNLQSTRRVDGKLLRRAARLVLSELLEFENFDLGICLVDNQEITRLNESFLNHKGATDVITFDYSENSAGLPRHGEPVGDEVTSLEYPKLVGVQKKDSLPRLLQVPGPMPHRPLHGEIFICVAEACAQARRFHTSWQDELARYVVHGVLHLCGYDDQQAAARRQMKREEKRLLQWLSQKVQFRKLARKG